MNNVLYANEISFKNFEHLEVEVVPQQKSVWLYFNPQPRSCFTLTLLRELDRFQSILKQQEGRLVCDGEFIDIEFNIIASSQPVFNFGGDLDHFVECIENQDREALKNYARLCIDAVYYNHIGRELDLTTISLVKGDALGGGFEAALSSNVIIAEKNAEFGLPEVLFNLFPGMGAYNLLSQRLTPVMAEKLILSGKRYSATEMYEMGVIDILADSGEGEAAVNNYIRSYRNRFSSLRSINRVRRIVNPVNYQQLNEIGDIWVDAALNLSDKDQRIMSRLVRSQQRFAIPEEDVAVRQMTAS
ncbi:MAG TPA: crotonase/enoyl-CoA hydratase family protein [Gammaproteobacteria bacterium]|nr:crotonase/enoyl-CoA hydratase family protein [Gammaproteobacteria bacterium]